MPFMPSGFETLSCPRLVCTDLCKSPSCTSRCRSQTRCASCSDGRRRVLCPVVSPPFFLPPCPPFVFLALFPLPPPSLCSLVSSFPSPSSPLPPPSWLLGPGLACGAPSPACSPPLFGPPTALPAVHRCLPHRLFFCQTPDPQTTPDRAVRPVRPSLYYTTTAGRRCLAHSPPLTYRPTLDGPASAGCSISQAVLKPLEQPELQVVH